MQSQVDLEREIDAWSPRARQRASRLGYVEAAAVDGVTAQLSELARAAGVAIAVDLWCGVLEDTQSPTSLELLLIVEHLRGQPAAMADRLRTSNSRSFAKTLANASFRAACSIYEDARELLHQGEIDRSLTLFLDVRDELLFAIHSNLLTEATLRQAHGKLATTVAFVGRWRRLNKAVLLEALSASEVSLELGNLDPTTIRYRVELLLQLFDETGDEDALLHARGLVREHPDLTQGSELQQAEIRLRLAASTAIAERKDKYLRNAALLLKACKPETPFDDAHRVALRSVLQAIEDGISPDPTLLGVPAGLARLAHSGPDHDSMKMLLGLIAELQALWKGSGCIPAANMCIEVLRGLMRSQPRNDAVCSAYEAMTRSLAGRLPHDRHLAWEAAVARLERAREAASIGPALGAYEAFVDLGAQHQRWPLPPLGAAQSAELLHASGPQLPYLIRSPVELWSDAANLAATGADYIERSLGGRSQVFVLDDARGFMAESFVFKPLTLLSAGRERDRLRALGRLIERRGLGGSFAVPTSIALVPWNGDEQADTLHIIRRSSGREIGELTLDEKAAVLPQSVDLLSLYHEAIQVDDSGPTPWKTIKDGLKRWLRSFVSADEAAEITQLLKQSYPDDVPALSKRDSHGGNWLLDESGRLVALDMETAGALPAGHDVAQLIEDSMMLPVDESAWRQRHDLFARYLRNLSIDISAEKLAHTYCWFALFRAIWMATAPTASKAQRRHARALVSLISRQSDGQLAESAKQIGALLLRSEKERGDYSPPSGSHRRLSRQLSFVLRHRGPDVGVAVDDEGYADLRQVAAHLGVDVTHIERVVDHPVELRFQIDDGRIRALYGHSLPVEIDAMVATKPPEILYHGTAWDSLRGVLDHGLRPMRRRKVHLSTSAAEASDVGQRHGCPIVLAIEVDEELAPVPVADGLWVTGPVERHRLRIVNSHSQIGARRLG